METGYPEAVATLVGLADGTTSMYFSNGGGMIGAGQHPQVAASDEALARVGRRRSLDDLPETPGDVQLPDEGDDPVRGGDREPAAAPRERPEDELGGGGHPLSPLFYAGHDVITAIRVVDERAET